MYLGLLLDQWDKDWLIKAQETHCYSVHLNRKTLTQAHIQEIKAHGYRLFVYTVNRKRSAKKMLTWGVDAIFSDYPDLLTT
jgi:glycerophosphoryl diester phosphodiesterase